MLIIPDWRPDWINDPVEPKIKESVHPPVIPQSVDPIITQPVEVTILDDWEHIIPDLLPPWIVDRILAIMI